MNKRKNNQKPGANIVRISRLESIKPINISTGNFDFKKQFYNPSQATKAEHCVPSHSFF